MAAAAGAKFQDLSDAFSRPECYCLNEHPSHPFGNLFIGDHTLQLKSDADGADGADGCPPSPSLTNPHCYHPQSS